MTSRSASTPGASRAIAPSTSPRRARCSTAYGRERAMSEAEQDALPLLARGAALRFLLTRLVDFLNVPPGALVQPKDPLEYVRKLRFQQGVASMRDYGVALQDWWRELQLPSVTIHTDGACSGNPGSGRLGRDPQIRRRREGDEGRRGPYHQQPHGVDGGDLGAGSAEKAVHGRSLSPTASMSVRASPAGSTAGRGTAGAPPTRSRSRTSNCGSGSMLR